MIPDLTHTGSILVGLVEVLRLLEIELLEVVVQSLEDLLGSLLAVSTTAIEYFQRWNEQCL